MMAGRIAWSCPQDCSHEEAVALGCPAGPVQVSVDIRAAADPEQHPAAHQLLHLPDGVLEPDGVVEGQHPMLCRESCLEPIVHAPSVTDRAVRAWQDERLWTVDTATSGLWMRTSDGRRRLCTLVPGRFLVPE